MGFKVYNIKITNQIGCYFMSSPRTEKKETKLESSKLTSTHLEWLKNELENFKFWYLTSGHKQKERIKQLDEWIKDLDEKLEAIKLSRDGSVKSEAVKHFTDKAYRFLEVWYTAASDPDNFPGDKHTLYRDAGEELKLEGYSPQTFRHTCNKFLYLILEKKSPQPEKTKSEYHRTFFCQLFGLLDKMHKVMSSSESLSQTYSFHDIWRRKIFNYNLHERFHFPTASDIYPIPFQLASFPSYEKALEDTLIPEEKAKEGGIKEGFVKQSLEMKTATQNAKDKFYINAIKWLNTQVNEVVKENRGSESLIALAKMIYQAIKFSSLPRDNPIYSPEEAFVKALSAVDRLGCLYKNDNKVNKKIKNDLQMIVLQSFNYYFLKPPIQDKSSLSLQSPRNGSTS